MIRTCSTFQAPFGIRKICVCVTTHAGLYLFQQDGFLANFRWLPRKNQTFINWNAERHSSIAHDLLSTQICKRKIDDSSTIVKIYLRDKQIRILVSAIEICQSYAVEVFLSWIVVVFVLSYGRKISLGTR